MAVVLRRSVVVGRSAPVVGRSCELAGVVVFAPSSAIVVTKWSMAVVLKMKRN